MANKTEATPKDYDRWDGVTGIKVIKPAPKQKGGKK
jgi:hypothetical protein